jgi:acyl-CoA reductase-like NAD-dependent aldehyde dehydrogenase
VTPEVDRLLAGLGDALVRWPEPTQHWVAAELRHVRRAAQAEADEAYEAWRHHPRRATYAAYRAAQDRADAAQDHLAQWLAHSNRG